MQLQQENNADIKGRGRGATSQNGRTAKRRKPVAADAEEDDEDEDEEEEEEEEDIDIPLDEVRHCETCASMDTIRDSGGRRHENRWSNFLQQEVFDAPYGMFTQYRAEWHPDQLPSCSRCFAVPPAPAETLEKCMSFGRTVPTRKPPKTGSRK